MQIQLFDENSMDEQWTDIRRDPRLLASSRFYHQPNKNLPSKSKLGRTIIRQITILAFTQFSGDENNGFWNRFLLTQIVIS